MTIKLALVFWLTLTLVVAACGSTTPLPAPETAPVIEATSIDEPDSVPVQNPTAEPKAETDPVISAPSDLRIVYIREGNLWSWTEAGGSVQLTGTGDMSTASVSSDGQLLAFMRGREVWTVRMDGMGARLLSTQANEGGALWFSPDGSLLAISTKDHIDVISLVDATSITVVTYPALPDRYYPEVIWSPDGIGFKTVIPPQTESGQAELLFVFTNGTVASLAKFSMVNLSESRPHISPDGGYIIYVSKLSEDNESLYLMDSSGATKPYGEPADNIRTYGWLPDSKHFAYGGENLPRAFMGNVGGVPIELAVTFPLLIRWVDSEHFIALEKGDLELGNKSGTSTPIDSAVQDFDIVH
jgi:hypothetical protein